MSEGMDNDNLIATLDSSLRKTRNAQTRLVTRLREVESEAEVLRQEIEALESSAEQTGAAIYSLLAMRSGKKAPRRLHIDEDYELPDEIRRITQRESRLQENIHSGGRQDEYPNNSYRENRDNLNNRDNHDYRDNRNSSIAYINSNRRPNNSDRGVPTVSPDIEPISHRFADRTITQACTLLLRESGKPLHVNELYNLLVAGGFQFKGNNPTISIAVSLNRNRRFDKVAPGTFDLLIREAAS